MKRYARACMMCLSMFCAIPCPCRRWDEEARPLMLLFLPVVGVWIGALWTLLSYLMRWLALPAPVGAALLCVFPFLITGGIHFDGYLDVTDAVRSRRSLDERRRILKDPHTGSFAVLAGVVLMLLQFAFLCAADGTPLALLLIAVVSRTMSGLCIAALRPMQTSEYAGAFRRGVRRAHLLVLLLVLAAAVCLGFLLLGRYGFAALAVIGGYLLCLRRAFRSLDGMSGDIAGYALTCGELLGIVVFALI